MVAVNPLLRKAFRDLWRSCALFISIIALLTLGVGIFVTMYSAFLNVKSSEDFAYEELKFADAFYHVAPSIPIRAVDAIRDIEGVAVAEGRYVANIAIRQPDDPDNTLSARVISIPDDETPDINRVIVREGEYLEAGDGRHALVDNLFTSYYDLMPGDSISLVYRGRDREFKISGAITSPEYLWKSKGGAELLTSPGDFAILMVRRNAVDDMLGVEGVINEITVRFQTGADTEAIKSEIDRYLNRYGSHQLIEREQQLSYATLKSDIDGFEEVAIAIPVLFLSITALVAYAMLTRIVQSQRQIIGLMRAEGFSRGHILRHYLTFPVLIALIGNGLGILWGTLAAGGFTSLYIGTLDLPFTVVVSQVWVLVAAFATGLAACVIAGIQPAIAAARLTPSEAMRTDISSGGASIMLEKLLPMQRLPGMLRLALRNMTRGRWRTLSSIVSIAVSVALVTAVMGMLDTMDNAFDVQFNEIQQHDLKALFTHDIDHRKTDVFQSWPQVRKAEPIAEIPVKLVNGEYSEYSVVTAVPDDATLLKPEYVEGAQPLSSNGIFLTETLASDLNLKVGDTVKVESERRDQLFPVAGLVRFPMGDSAYMRLSQAAILMRGFHATAALITLEHPDYAAEVTQMLEMRAYVLSVERSADVREGIEELMALTNQFIGIMTIFGMSLAAFAVFNTVTLNVTERSRELATMRTLGFSRRQVNMLITTESLITGVGGIILGFAIGYAIEAYLIGQMSSLDWNMDIIIDASTYIIVGALTLAVLLLSQVPGLRALHRRNLAEATKELAS